LAFVEGVGYFEAKYWVEGLRLPPTSIHREIREWFYFNSAAGSFHIKNYVAEFIQFK